MFQCLVTKKYNTLKGLEGLERCGGFNRCGSHRLMCLDSSPIESGTISRRRKCVNTGEGFEVYAQAMPNVPHSLLLLSADQENCHSFSSAMSVCVLPCFPL